MNIIKKVPLICIVLLISIIFINQNAFSDETDTESSDIPDSSNGISLNINDELKDPYVGLTLAIFPGIGTGHFYSGHVITGILFFAVEMSSLIVFGYFRAHTSSNVECDDDVFICLNKMANNLNTAFSNIGLGIFFATKTAEIISAPLLVRRYNRNITSRISFSVNTNLLNQQSGLMIAPQMSLRF